MSDKLSKEDVTNPSPLTQKEAIEKHLSHEIVTCPKCGCEKWSATWTPTHRPDGTEYEDDDLVTELNCVECGFKTLITAYPNQRFLMDQTNPWTYNEEEMSETIQETCLHEEDSGWFASDKDYDYGYLQRTCLNCGKVLERETFRVEAEEDKEDAD